MSGPVINGFQASWKEWFAVRTLLAGVDREAALGAMQDMELTGEELDDILKYASNDDVSDFDLDDFEQIYSRFLASGEALRHTLKNCRGFSMFLYERLDGASVLHLKAGGDMRSDALINDRKFALELVKRKGSAIKALNEDLRNDKEIASVAIRNDPAATQYVTSEELIEKFASRPPRWGGAKLRPEAYEVQMEDQEMILARIEKDADAIKSVDPKLFESEEFLIKVAKRNPWALLRISHMVEHNRRIALEAVKEDGYAIRIFSEEVQNDKEVVKAAVSRTPDLYQELAEEFRNDKEIAVALVSANGKSLEALNGRLRADRDVVLAAVKNFGHALEYADDLLKSDAEIVLAASHNPGYYRSIRNDRRRLLKEVVTDSFAFAVASEALKNDIDFSVEMAVRNLNVFRFMTKRERTAYWNLFVRKYGNRLDQAFTEDELSSYESFIKAIEDKYDIKFVRRLYGLDTLIEVLNNNTDPAGEDDNRPKAVLIYNRTDWNGGFETNPMSYDLLKLGYRVLYYDVDDEESMVRKLDEATGGGKYKADLIVLGGHGTETSIKLGEDEEEENYIDTDDYKDGDVFEFGRYLKDNGQMILDACSTGRGGAENPYNLANTIARTLPPSATVQSATVDTSINEVKKAGRGVVVEFSSGKNFKVSGGAF